MQQLGRRFFIIARVKNLDNFDRNSTYFHVGTRSTNSSFQEIYIARKKMFFRKKILCNSMRITSRIYCTFTMAFHLNF